MNKYYRMVLRLSVILVISCAVGDDSPPAQIDDFSTSSNNKLFGWTAPGDDGNSGKATLYLLRFFDENQVKELLDVSSLESLDDNRAQQAILQNNFHRATQVPRFFAPRDAGSSETASVPRLDILGQKRYFYSIVANDETGNSSKPSNFLELTSGLSSVDFVGDQNSCLGASASFGEFMQGDQGDTSRDIIVGDPCSARVYIFAGREDITRNTGNVDMANPDVTIVGIPGTRFGASVEGVGNISSNSFDEFAIGAPNADNAKGQVFVFEGGQSLPEVIDLNSDGMARFIIIGEASGDKFGSEIARHGLNNLLVSAPMALQEKGKVYSFNSNELQDSTNAADAAEIIIGRSGDQLGYSIADSRMIGIGDRVFVAGAPGGGRAYVFFNTGDFDLSNLAPENEGDILVIQGNAEDRFGETVDGGYDIDGVEGNTDVVISAPSADNNKGSVFVYSDEVLSGATDGLLLSTMDASLRIDGLVEGDKLGVGLAVLPDINPEIIVEQRDVANVLAQVRGNADIAIGAPGAESGKGKIYIFFGENDLSGQLSASSADITIPPSQGIDSFGLKLNTVLDVNGDGFFDFTVGSSNSLTLNY